MSRCVREQLGAGARVVVVGVHRRACHLGLDSGSLLVLGAPGVPLAPNGIAVEGAPGGFRVGQSVALGLDGDVDRGADRVVVFGEATVWEPRPRVRPVAPIELDGRLRMTCATTIAEGAGGSFLPLLWASGGGSGATGAACVPARLLREAAIRGDAASVGDAASRLAGLGPGLTPSGDDLLAGFAAAWTLVGESLELDGAHRGHVASALFVGARAGASPLGRAWLAHAVRGELPEPMTRFVGELCTTDEPRGLVPAVRAMLAVGASSGTDWTVGFLLGASAVLEAAPWS